MKKEKWSTPMFLLAVIVAVGIWGFPAFASRNVQEVRFIATEFAFDPSALNVKPGKVTFVVKNVGLYPHALAIQGIRNATPVIQPGRTAKLTVNVTKRNAVFFCPLEGHRERGMEGRFVVE